MAYLRSLEDSPRVRAACIQYMRNWLIFFYPERMDLVRKAEQKAQDFGGTLGAPKLSWKYSWIRALFGWDLAKRAQVFLPSLRWTVARLLDKLCFDSKIARRWELELQQGLVPAPPHSASDQTLRSRKPGSQNS